MKKLIILLVALILLSCLPSGAALADTGPNGTTRVRFVNALINTAPQDVYIDGNLIFRNVPYRGVTEYVRVTPGQHTVRIVNAGTPIADPSGRESSFGFNDLVDYTILSVERPDNQNPLLLFDNDSNQPPAGKARVRFIHASPGTPDVDVCVAGSDVCPFLNVRFVEGSNYTEVDANSYTLDVRQVGSDRTLVTTPALNFASGGVYSVYLVGLEQGNPALQVIPGLDAGTPPTSPPTSGAFLAPEAIAVLVVVGLLLMTGSGYLFKRYRTRPV